MVQVPHHTKAFSILPMLQQSIEVKVRVLDINSLHQVITVTQNPEISPVLRLCYRKTADSNPSSNRQECIFNFILLYDMKRHKKSSCLYLLSLWCLAKLHLCGPDATSRQAGSIHQGQSLDFHKPFRAHPQFQHEYIKTQAN